MPSGMFFKKWFEGFNGESIVSIVLEPGGANYLRIGIGYPLNTLLLDINLLTKTGSNGGKPNGLYIAKVLGVKGQLSTAIAYYDTGRNKTIIELMLTDNKYPSVTVFCYSANCTEVNCQQTSQYNPQEDTDFVNAVIT